MSRSEILWLHWIAYGLAVSFSSWWRKTRTYIFTNLLQLYATCYFLKFHILFMIIWSFYYCLKNNLRVFDFVVESRSFKKLLGIVIDNGLAFRNHYLRQCSPKFSTLARISIYLNVEKFKVLFDCLYSALLLNYCP